MAELKLNVDVDVHGQDKLQSLGRTLGSGAIGLAKFAAGAAVGVAAIGGAATKMAADAEAAQTKVVGTFKSMGAASWTTVKALDAQAEAMMNATAFDDEGIKEAQATLLTFGKVTGEAFEQATASALDMSQFFGTDLQAASVQLGKALNDPIKGLGSLTRIGVQFTDKQKELIAGFVEAGDVASAQGIILGELNRQMGTAAEDFAGTTSGMMAQVGNQIGEVGESLGAAILPLVKEMLPGIIAGLQSFATWITANMPTIREVIGNVMAGIGTAFTFIFTEVVPRVIAVFSSLFGAVQANMPSIQAIISTVFTTVGNIIQWVSTNVIPPLVAAFKTVVAWVSANWPTISSTFSQVFGAISNAVKVIWPIVSAIATVLFPLVSTAATVLFRALDGTFKLIGGVFEVVGNVVTTMVRGITNAWTVLEIMTKAIWGGISGAIRGAINAVIWVINGFLGFLNGLSFGFPGFDGPFGIHIDSFTIDPFNIPLIPQLAEGGIVTSPTLAMIGERGPEAVVPLDKGFGETHFHSHIEVKGEEPFIRNPDDLIKVQQRIAFLEGF